MAVKANRDYVLYFKESEVDEDFHNLRGMVEQLKREYDELNQQSFFELSDRQGNVIAYIGDDGEVYIPDNSDLIIKEIKGELEVVTELTILDDQQSEFRLKEANLNFETNENRKVKVIRMRNNVSTY